MYCRQGDGFVYDLQDCYQLKAGWQMSQVEEQINYLRATRTKVAGQIKICEAKT